MDLCPRAAMCGGCGYDLRGLGDEAPCPECGSDPSARLDLGADSWKRVLRDPRRVVRIGALATSLIGTATAAGLIVAEWRVRPGIELSVVAVGAVVAVWCAMYIPMAKWCVLRQADEAATLRVALLARTWWWFMIPFALVPVEVVAYIAIGHRTDPGVCSGFRDATLRSVAWTLVGVRSVVLALFFVVQSRGRWAQAGLIPMPFTLVYGLGAVAIGALCSISGLGIVVRALDLDISYHCQF